MSSRSGLTAGQVAQLVGGELVGRHDVVLAGVAPLDRAGPGDLSFLASGRYLAYFRRARAGAVLLTPVFRDEAAGPATRIVVTDAVQALGRALHALYPETPPQWGVHHTAQIGQGTCWTGRLAVGPGAVLGRNVRLGDHCVVGPHAVVEDNVTLGQGCRIEAHAVVHAGALLGDRVLVRTGARVGGKGFGFAQTKNGPEPIPQVGRCVIGDDVEVGANTTIDRGSLDDTVIGPATKMDNLVQIAHNVRIGARCIIMAQVGVAGSTVVEDEVLLAGQAGLADHLTVGRGARVAAQSGVIGDIAPGATVSGYPARSHRAVLRQAAAVARLTPLVASIERMIQGNEPS
ncbi:MAG: UDP-3-O-(3-hydroxymyristoyl)glucosamine N-acyltransferase [Gemmatimonadales bacterium]|nr:UDP-3-O-(3-hydroxymyristoyl)glucosamine N-acyltransferase [Gemmatimonadales bacterium]